MEIDPDDELFRFEAVLASQPDDRALPELGALLDAAGVDESLLVVDERARKLWVDALTTRPFGELSAVREVATEVELLVLEVRSVTSTLRRTDVDEAERRAAGERLAWVRARLAELTEQL